MTPPTTGSGRPWTRRRLPGEEGEGAFNISTAERPGSAASTASASRPRLGRWLRPTAGGRAVLGGQARLAHAAARAGASAPRTHPAHTAAACPSRRANPFTRGSSAGYTGRGGLSPTRGEAVLALDGAGQRRHPHMQSRRGGVARRPLRRGRRHYRHLAASRGHAARGAVRIHSPGRLLHSPRGNAPPAAALITKTALRSTAPRRPEPRRACGSAAAVSVDAAAHRAGYVRRQSARAGGACAVLWGGSLAWESLCTLRTLGREPVRALCGRAYALCVCCNRRAAQPQLREAWL